MPVLLYLLNLLALRLTRTDVNTVFPYGLFITAIITFLLTMAIIYFVVVVPMTAAVNKLKRDDKPAIAQPSNEEKLLVEIRDALRAR